MRIYFADANIFLRLLLQDNDKQLKEVKEYLYRARIGEIELRLEAEVIFEVEYVLRKTYGILRGEVGEKLLRVIKTRYVEISERDLWLEALDAYVELNVDLVDALLFYKSRSVGAEVLSFDKDFEKLKRFGEGK